MLRKPKESQRNLVADHVVALNNQCKLESANAVLNHDNKVLAQKVLKLSEALKVSQEKILEKEDFITKIQDSVKMFNEKHREETVGLAKKIQKSKNVERKLKTEVETLKGDMDKMQQQLIKVIEDLEFYKSKSKEYKMKLKNSMELLGSLNQLIESRTTFSDKQCQTKELRTKVDLELEENRFDEQILSELFFKENPFTDMLLL